MELANLRRVGRNRASSRRVEKHSNRKGQVVIIGAAILDFTAKIRSTHILVSSACMDDLMAEINSCIFL